jgi:hypothetical protein
LTIGSVRVGYGLNYDATVGGGCITSPNGSVRVVAAEVSHCLATRLPTARCAAAGDLREGQRNDDDSLITQNGASAGESIPHVAGGGASPPATFSSTAA